MDAALDPAAQAPPQPIADLKPRHQAIIDHIVAQPWMPLGDVALLFQCSPAWLSRIMRSDLFRAALAARQQEAFDAELTTTRDRIDALADLALERLSERIQTEQDTAKITKAAELALRASNYITHGNSAAAVGTTINASGNVVILQPADRDTLAEARQRMRQRFAGALESIPSEAALGADPALAAPQPPALPPALPLDAPQTPTAG